jgi:hypothetical protein
MRSLVVAPSRERNAPGPKLARTRGNRPASDWAYNRGRRENSDAVRSAAGALASGFAVRKQPSARDPRLICPANFGKISYNHQRQSTPPHTKAIFVFDQSTLLWALFFGSFGLGYFTYGRKERTVVPLVCGLALMIFPYFVATTAVMVSVGGVLLVIPYFFRF